jgi:hypothetical protein
MLRLEGQGFEQVGFPVSPAVTAGKLGVAVCDVAFFEQIVKCTIFIGKGVLGAAVHIQSWHAAFLLQEGAEVVIGGEGVAKNTGKGIVLGQQAGDVDLGGMDRDHGKLLAMLQAEFQGAIATHAHAANATTSAMIDGIEMLIDETDGLQQMTLVVEVTTDRVGVIALAALWQDDQQVLLEGIAFNAAMPEPGAALLAVVMQLIDHAQRVLLIVWRN